MTNEVPKYPAGWYADANIPGTERYYDGGAWTQHSRPAQTVPAEGGKTITKAPWYKRKAIVIPVGIVAALIVIAVIGGALGAGKGKTTTAVQAQSATPLARETAIADATVPDTTGTTAKEAAVLLGNAGLEVEFSAAEGVVIDRDNWTVLSTTPAAGTVVKPGDTVVVNVQKTPKATATTTPAAPPAAQEPVMTTAQSSAVRSAQSYLEFRGFSRAGLTQQLTSEYGEGFSAEDAEFAISYLESTGAVDWNQEAAQAAKSYLDLKGFSRDGLYDQLTSEYGEGFTPDQANFGLDAVGL